MVDHFSGKHKALGSISSTGKTKTKQVKLFQNFKFYGTKKWFASEKWKGLGANKKTPVTAIFHAMYRGSICITTTVRHTISSHFTDKNADWGGSTDFPQGHIARQVTQLLCALVSSPVQWGPLPFLRTTGMK
jgi:hypothetical protein